ncbi:hypothetical protein CMI37_31355 [Candidatus Pacearchaeota archaeon]|nr:hypothetical protein [Candidatus Pacearchaeota archaeon]|tara:strand:+ start:2738 stop:3013 length:276 start_codon:yes stop_codon:yes gene_type:complete
MGGSPDIYDIAAGRKPKVAPKGIIQLKDENGGWITASTELWIWAFMKELDPTVRQRVVNRVKAMNEKLKKDSLVIPVSPLNLGDSENNRMR